MKIGLVCPYNITKGGGVLEIVLATQKELIKRGHSVKVITPLPRDTDVIDMPDVIFVGTSTDFRSPTHTQVQVSASGDTDKIDVMLRQEQFDILHFHEPWVPILSRQILQRSQSVNIATFHAKIPETLMSRTIIRVVTPYLKGVLEYLHELTAVSASAAEYVGGLTDQPINIIPNGIDLTKYKRTGKLPTKAAKTILYVGRLERRKGVKYLLQAYQLLEQQDPSVSLIIAGDGPDREKMEMLADDLQLKNVSFLGYVSEEVKLQLLSSADLFVSPALYGESFGIVLLEAMAMGVVSIAGNNSGYTDLMQELGAVSIINPRDQEEFARRMKLMLHDESIQALWRNWAKGYVTQFSWPTIVDQYEAYYEAAMKRNQHNG